MIAAATTSCEDRDPTVLLAEEDDRATCTQCSSSVRRVQRGRCMPGTGHQLQSVLSPPIRRTGR